MKKNKDNFIKTLINFREVYGDFLLKKNLETNARLFVTSIGELETDFKSEDWFNDIFNGLSTQFSSFHYLGNGSKTHPLKLDTVESIVEANQLVDKLLGL